MNKIVFSGLVLLCCLLAAASGCAGTIVNPASTPATTPSTTTPMARKRREVDAMEVQLDDDYAIISALTFFKYSNDDVNGVNADKVEEQIREFVSVEQIKESKFGTSQRKMLKDDTGFLRVAYVLTRGGRYCDELVKLAVKAINLAENIAEGEVTCNGEQVDVKKID